MLAVIFSTYLPAQSQPFFIYSDIQAMGGHPLIGGGIRFKDRKLSLDFSGNALTKDSRFSSLIFHTKAQLLFYPMKSLYFGAGLGLLKEPETIKGISGSWEGAIGFEWRTYRHRHFFLEVGSISPFKKPKADILKVWPSLTFGYGF